MDFDFEIIDRDLRYKLLCAFVAPRPIALVTTISDAGIHNAAPFSFFNVFGDEPPIIILGIQDRPNGEPKDTTQNITDNGEFVAHMVDRQLGKEMVECSVDFSADIDETIETGLHLADSKKIRPKRIVEAPVAMECRLERTIEYPGRSIIFGHVVHMQVRDNCIDPETLYVNSDKYQPIARLHADNYIVSNDQFEIYKPTLDEFRAKQYPGKNENRTS